MKRRWVILVAVGLLNLWLAAGLAYAQEAKGAVATVGNLQVEFIPAGSGLVEGDNQIAVQLKDTATGKPVVQNSLRVEMTMDTGDKSMSHGDMSNQKPVLAELRAASDVAGRYTGKINLSGAGRWNAKVYIDGQRSTLLSVNVAAGAGSTNLFLIAGAAAAVVVLAIAGIFVFKRKGAAATGVGAASESVDRARLSFGNTTER